MSGFLDGPRVWRAEEGLHVDVRGLPCSEPLIHVQKAEMAMLPLIEDTMDSETERRLYEIYTGKR